MCCSLGGRIFFFQAEDGIRDGTVTGVQTCALPILLNISYMVLGKYPLEVPRPWLIPPETFKSDYDVGLFRDVAASRRVDAFGRAGGVILEDFDNDGHLDLMVSHMGIEEQLEYFHNNG